MPSPLHRDPETDGDDYGVYTDENNAKVAGVVRDAIAAIKSGALHDSDDVIDFVRPRLERIPSACDTIVKENVFGALDEALSEAGIHIEPFAIYGW